MTACSDISVLGRGRFLFLASCSHLAFDRSGQDLSQNLSAGKSMELAERRITSARSSLECCPDELALSDMRPLRFHIHGIKGLAAGHEEPVSLGAPEAN